MAIFMDITVSEQVMPSNLSCDQFNQSCMAEGKIAPGVSMLPYEAK